MAFFFFGTLRDRDVLALVIGRNLPEADVEIAEIRGYRLARVVDENYPALLPQIGGRVVGVLVSNFSASELDRLAWFEGKEYRCEEVTVRLLESGKQATASIQSATDHLTVADGDWEFGHWQRSEKDLLIALTRRHMALFGHVSLDEAIAAWDRTREELHSRRAVATADKN